MTKNKPDAEERGSFPQTPEEIAHSFMQKIAAKAENLLETAPLLRLFENFQKNRPFPDVLSPERRSYEKGQISFEFFVNRSGVLFARDPSREQTEATGAEQAHTADSKDITSFFLTLIRLQRDASDGWSAIMGISHEITKESPVFSFNAPTKEGQYRYALFGSTKKLVKERPSKEQVDRVCRELLKNPDCKWLYLYEVEVPASSKA